MTRRASTHGRHPAAASGTAGRRPVAEQESRGVTRTPVRRSRRVPGDAQFKRLTGEPHSRSGTLSVIGVDPPNERTFPIASTINKSVSICMNVPIATQSSPAGRACATSSFHRLGAIASCEQVMGVVARARLAIRDGRGAKRQAGTGKIAGKRVQPMTLCCWARICLFSSPYRGRS